MTVTGRVPATELGVTLPHEHLLVDFVPVAEQTGERYDPNEAFEVILPYLEQLVALGCQTLIDATPEYLGRDVRLLERLSRAADLHIVTNTGYYGAREDQHIPPHAEVEDARALAQRWVAEWRSGIAGTTVKPGFMKIGVDAAPLEPLDRKLVRAAAKAHLQTGLTIAAHTGPAEGAFEELEILAEEGVRPEAWIWVHAQNEQDEDAHVRAASLGGWVEFDGVSAETAERHADLVANMHDAGLLHRVLVSHDAGWYSVGEPGGGRFRSFDALFTEFIPALRERGFSNEEIDQLIVKNPASAFAMRVRESEAG